MESSWISTNRQVRGLCPIAMAPRSPTWTPVHAPRAGDRRASQAQTAAAAGRGRSAAPREKPNDLSDQTQTTYLSHDQSSRCVCEQGLRRQEPGVQRRRKNEPGLPLGRSPAKSRIRHGLRPCLPPRTPLERSGPGRGQGRKPPTISAIRHKPRTCRARTYLARATYLSSHRSGRWLSVGQPRGIRSPPRQRPWGPRHCARRTPAGSASPRPAPRR